MKSCLGILLIFFTFIAVVGGGVGIWYLSNTAEFVRTAPPTEQPKTQPVPSRPNAPARPTIPARPLAPKNAPKPAIPNKPSSPFGNDTPPEIPD